MGKTAFPKQYRAFSLLEMAVVLVIVGLMVGVVSRTHRVTVEPSGCYAETKKQLATIHDAMVAFERKNQRLPVLAGRSLGSANPNFGRETNLATSLANIDRLNSSNNLLFGALPFQALGLSEYYAADCWGNKFSYVVTEKMTTSATSGGYRDPATRGGITLKSSGAVTVADASATPSKGLAYMVISHGESAMGAVKKNYSNPAHAWCSVTTELDSENCDITNSTLVTASYNNGAGANAAFYDDLVTFGGKIGTGVPKIYAWGGNWFSQLGDGTSTTRTSPVFISLPGAAVPESVYAGIGQSCALDTVGKAYCWGLNQNGSLGNGSSANSNVPVPVTMPAGVKFTKLAIGHRHVCAMGDNGRGYCWGNNDDGQRGDGVTGLPSSTPNPVDMTPLGGATFVDIAAADNVNCAIASTGKTYCWGNGSTWRQTGAGTATNYSIPTLVTMPAGITFTRQVSSYTTMCAVGNDKAYYCWGTNIDRRLGNNPASTSIPAISLDGPVSKAVSGQGLTCAILENTETWCFGDDGNGSPGLLPAKQALPAGVPAFTALAINAKNRCGLAANGRLYCIGKNTNGELGNGTTTDSSADYVSPNFAVLGVTQITKISGFESHYLAIGF